MASRRAGTTIHGRFQQRHWDGTAWTEHVATNGVQQVEPMGASTVVPFATPASAFRSPAGDARTAHGFAATADLSDPNAQAPLPQPPAEGNLVTRFLDGMGDDARLRPRPSMRSALAGICGVMVAVGLLIAVVGENASRGKLAGVSLVLLLAALVLRLLVKIPEVQAAAVGMAVVAIPTFAGAATISDGSGGALTYLLGAALFLAAWALKGFRGRTLLLGLGLLTMVGVFSTLISDVSQDKCETYIEDNDFDRYFGGVSGYVSDGSAGNLFLPNSVTDNLGDQGIVYLVSAAVLLAATWWLDRRLPRHRYRHRGRRPHLRGRRGCAAGRRVRRHRRPDHGGGRRRAGLPGRRARCSTIHHLVGCAAGLDRCGRVRGRAMGAAVGEQHRRRRHRHRRGVDRCAADRRPAPSGARAAGRRWRWPPADRRVRPAGGLSRPRAGRAAGGEPVVLAVQ
jgi:hypothetical protein